MFPGANKNIRRLQRIRNIVYVIMLLVGLAILGAKTLLAH